MDYVLAALSCWSAMRPGIGRSGTSRSLRLELSRRYGLSLDFAAKRSGLEAVARALRCGETARAQIAALLLKLPDPPPRGAVDLGERERLTLALDLVACNLLKVDPDWDAKHPRTGTSPYPNRFATKPKDPETDKPPRPASGWPPKEANEAVKSWLEEIAGQATWRGTEALINRMPYGDAIIAFLDVMEPQPTNLYELRLEQQLRANFAAPKTLEELQSPPDGDPLGYERHHIVEQNDDNVAKDELEIELAVIKFGRDALDADSNIAWIPRLKHEQITGDYNSSPEDETLKGRVRDQVNKLDFAGQREFGLSELRKYGILE